MNKINKLKRLLAVMAIFCLMVVSSQVKTYTHIGLKGLFEVLKIDDIGVAHALLHSSWIENMYQYAEGKPHMLVVGKRNREQWKSDQKNDAVANLIRKFWFRKSENHQLLPTKFGYLANIPNAWLGNFFGKLINYVYKGCPQHIEDGLVYEFLKYDPEYQQFKQEELVGLLRKVDERVNSLKDQKFDAFKKAKKIERDEINRLEKKYNMANLKIAITQASKRCKADTSLKFKDEKKKVESRFNSAGFYKALKATKKRIFRGITQEIQDEYCKNQANIKKIKAVIVRKLKKKRDAIKKALFTPIKKALEFCKTDRKYAPRIVESVLWALFFHKLDDLISMEEKIKAINSCIDRIGKEFKREGAEKLVKFYEQQDFVGFKERIEGLCRYYCVDECKQVDEMFESYDLALNFFIKRGKGFSPVIAQGQYGYEYESGKISQKRPDCYGAAILDVFSNLWYNKQKNAFDDSLFSEKVIQNGKGFQRLREALKYLYLADSKKIRPTEYTCKYKGRSFTSIEKLKNLGKISQEEIEALDITKIPVSYITRPEIRQEFFNIVSGLVDQGVVYCSKAGGNEKNFELECDVRNIIKIFNYFYGTTCSAASRCVPSLMRGSNGGEPGLPGEASAKTGRRIEELEGKGTGISTDARTIKFELANDKNVPNNVKISVTNNRGGTRFFMIMNISSGHTYFAVPLRDELSFSVRLAKGTQEAILQKKDQDNARCLSLFTVLASKKLLKNENWDLPTLHLLYYSLMMKTPETKLKIIQDVLERRLHNYDVFKGMIYNLVESFPVNDEYLRAALNNIIVKSGIYKKDSFFQQWIEKCTVNIFLYDIVENLDDYEQVLEIYNEFIEKIEDINEKQVIAVAIKRGYKKIAELIMKRQEFEVDKNPKLFDGKMLSAVIEYGFEDIALKIANHPQMDVEERDKGLILALKAGHKDVENIVSKIIEDSLFKADSSFVGQLLLTAVTKEYQKVALDIVKNPAFDASQALGEVHDGGDEVSYYSNGFSLSNNSFSYYSGNPWFREIFELALEKGYAKVAIKIMNNPQLGAEKRDYALMLALWRGAAEQNVQGKPLKKKHKNAVLKVLKSPTFKANSPFVGQLLLMVLTQGYQKVALRIVRNPTFDVSQGKIEITQLGEIYSNADGRDFVMGKVLALALKQSESSSCERQRRVCEDIAHKIMRDPEFTGWGTALVEIMKEEEGNKEIASRISKHFMFSPEWKNVGKALILALQNGFDKVVCNIVSHNRFKANFNYVGQALLLALTKGNREIALGIVNNCKFDASKGYWKVVTDPSSKSAGYNFVGDALIFALRSSENLPLSDIRSYDLFVSEVQDKFINSHNSRVKEMLKKEYKEIATRIMENPKFKDWGYVLYMLLKEGDTKIATKIVNDLRFDIDVRWAQKIIDYAQEFVRKNSEHKQELQELINIVERKIIEYKKLEDDEFDDEDSGEDFSDESEGEDSDDEEE